METTLQRFLDSSPFINSLGLKIETLDLDRETLTLRMPFQGAIERMRGAGQIHGGAVASLVDTAGCFALIMRKMDAVPTVNFRVDYLRPSVKTDLLAVAAVRRAGSNFGLVDIDVHNDEGDLVAVGRGTFGL